MLHMRSYTSDVRLPRRRARWGIVIGARPRGVGMRSYGDLRLVRGVFLQ